MPNYGKPFAGFCAATAIFLCSLAGYPIAPEFLPPSSGTLNLGSNAQITPVTPGATLIVKGDGFANGAAVTISVYSTPELLSEVVASAVGTIEATVTIPLGLAAGEHTVVALGNAPDGSARSLQARVNIIAQSQLPFTGSSIAGMAAGGLGLILVGFTLVRTAVHRRNFLPARGA